MAGNRVTLEIAGDAGSATRALGEVEQAASELETELTQVGQAARTMSTSVGSSEDAFETAARGANRFGEALDTANGATSILSGGIGDVGGAMTAFSDFQDLAATKALEHEKALLAVEQAQKDYDEAVKEFGANSLEARAAQLALTEAQQAAEPPTKMEEWGEKLELLSPIIMGLVGVTDLLTLANMALSASWVKTAAGAVASRVATIAGTVATGVATAAQWLWNIALTANPIGLIILAIVALVGVIVLIATKTTWFQDLWQAVWGAITAYFEFVVNAWKTVFTTVWDAIVAYFNFVVGAWKKAIGLIVDGAKWLIDKVTAIPGLISSAFSGLFGIITAPFRAAFNFVADAWNNTIGRLSWTIPSWVPGVGGNSISAPRLPKFHQGGVVPGPRGSEMLAILEGGERVIPAGGSGRAQVITVNVGGSRYLAALVEDLSGAIRAAGGDVQLVLGGRRG
jgi:hypothetical protein